MKRGTIQDLRQAASLIEKCRVENPRTQADLEDMIRRLRHLADDLTAAAVRQISGV